MRSQRQLLTVLLVIQKISFGRETTVTVCICELSVYATSERTTSIIRHSYAYLSVETVVCIIFSAALIALEEHQRGLSTSRQIYSGHRVWRREEHPFSANDTG